MVASNFPASLALVLQSEGGNDDDPADHGGRTSRGIQQKEYDAWRILQGQPILDVWQAPQSDIYAIYHDEYWNPFCDSIPLGVDYIYFNNSVLDGPFRSTVILQQALGVSADGRFGPITRMAVLNNNDPAGLITSISAYSRAFYKSLHQARFLTGWLNRVNFVQLNALQMINKGVTNAV